MRSIARSTATGAALIALLLPAGGAAWVSTTATSSDPTPAHWDLTDTGTDQAEVVGGEIVYRLHTDGSDDIADGSDLQALREAFETWSETPGSVLVWSEGTPTTTRSIDNDDLLPVFWDETGQFPIGGALAVTFTYVYTAGPEVGEIADTNIVFNGAYDWATDGRVGAFDIESVALHEIGHAFGLDHSPLGSATLWPYVGAGSTTPASPSTDDESAIRAKYPDLGTLTGTGSLTGFVSQSGGGLLHGAHVVVSDLDGGVVAGALSLADGTYEVPALDPGDYVVYVESIGGPRFGTGNLGGYWSTADTGFAALYDPIPITVAAGVPTIQDILAPPGSATLIARYIGRSDIGLWSSNAVQVQAGERIVEVGVAAENLPTAGDPLSVSGTDLPVLSTRFGTVGGYPAALVTLDVHNGVAPGHRSFVLTSGGERAYVSAGLEVLSADAIDDADGDTVSDADEGAPGLDTDGDTVPDYLDLDSDGDTVADADEAGDTDLATAPFDHDNDGQASLRDPDADGDSIADADEAGDADFATPPVDSDLDGTPDFLDLDSDDDTILDADEAGDPALATLPQDSDLDGTPDFRDLDSDDDGLGDAQEAGDANPTSAPVDTDLDGTPDFLDLDSDDDGVADGTLHETYDDFDGDGLHNFRDPDADDGGEDDGSEVAGGRNPLDPTDDLGAPQPLPGEVPDGTSGSQPVRVYRSGAVGLRMGWDAATDADTYRVYRGSLLVLSTGTWDAAAGADAGTCDTGGNLSFTDPQEIGDGGLYYYFVVGANTSGEGPGGSARPAGSGC